MRDDYKTINNQIKELLLASVAMLKIRDEQKVAQIVQLGQLSVDIIKRLNTVQNQEQLMQIAQEMTVVLPNLTLLLQRRLDSLSSANYVTVLKESIEILKTGVNDSIRITAEVLINNNERIQNTKRDIFAKLITAISKAMTVGKPKANSVL